MMFFQSLRRLMLFLAAISIPVAQAQVQPKPAEPAKQGAMPQTVKELPEVGSSAAAPVDPKAYRIGAEDVIGVRVWREPDLSGVVVVRPDGKVTLPLIGDQLALDLTPEKLAENLTQAYSTMLTSPRVSVDVLRVMSRKYYISGQVRNGGPMPLVVPITVMEALSQAGLSEWAKKNKIVIMRGAERLKFNYNDVLKGKNLDQNIKLQNGDHIFVP